MTKAGAQLQRIGAGLGWPAAEVAQLAEAAPDFNSPDGWSDWYDVAAPIMAEWPRGPEVAAALASRAAGARRPGALELVGEQLDQAARKASGWGVWVALGLGAALAVGALWRR